MPRAQFLVTVDAPSDVSIKEVRLYIRDAVEGMCKSLRPPGTYDVYDEGDPLYFIGDNVRVRRATPKALRHALIPHENLERNTK